MERLMINTSVKNCYNTCFVLEYNNEYLLYDCDTWTYWHVLGVIWIFRMIATMIKNGEYDGDFNIYYHDELVSTIETIIRLTVQKSIMIY